jgi:hypothetical protein
MIVVCLQPFPLQITKQIQSISSRIDSTVGCCVVSPTDRPPAINQFQLNRLMCAPLLLFLLLNCSDDAALSTPRVRKEVDCYVIEVLLVQQHLHLPPCTSFVHKSAELHQLVQSHQAISVDLMAKSAA